VPDPRVRPAVFWVHHGPGFLAAIPSMQCFERRGCHVLAYLFDLAVVSIPVDVMAAGVEPYGSAANQRGGDNAQRQRSEDFLPTFWASYRKSDDWSRDHVCNCLYPFKHAIAMMQSWASFVT
jgi:hypothetical protein